jgi:hypothetical protein
VVRFRDRQPERLDRIIAACPIAVINAADEADVLRHRSEADAFFGKVIAGVTAQWALTTPLQNCRVFSEVLSSATVPKRLRRGT